MLFKTANVCEMNRIEILTLGGRHGICVSPELVNQVGSNKNTKLPNSINGVKNKKSRTSQKSELF